MTAQVHLPGRGLADRPHPPGRGITARVEAAPCRPAASAGEFGHLPGEPLPQRRTLGLAELTGEFRDLLWQRLPVGLTRTAR